MSGEAGITVYSAQHPPAEVVRMIRRSMSAAGLAVSAELDLGSRLCREFHINFPRCTVLLVDSPAALLEALTYDRAAAVLMPLHLVVAEQHGATIVHLLPPSAELFGVLPVTARSAVSKLITAVKQRLEAILDLPVVG